MLDVDPELFDYYNMKAKYLKKYGLLDSKFKSNRFINVTEELVNDKLLNISQITFEVTDKCNLKCTYCAYGDFYENYEKRKNINIDINAAFNLLNYFEKLWRSGDILSYNKHVDIAFYGGEPLLNINFIRKIVSYVKNMKNINRIFTFSMTTNCILLDKYMDFLVDNNFNILISLDGDYKANEYRVNHNGDSVFNIILENVDRLITKYPNYFYEKVRFNSVLHDKNSLDSIYVFFKNKYKVLPRISSLNPTGVKKEKKKEFDSIYSSVVESLKTSKQKSDLIQDMSVSVPGYLDFVRFVYKCSGAYFNDYNELCLGINFKYQFPTGTCVPFEKKIFVTVGAKLLPCERIGSDFSFGEVNGNCVSFDIKSIIEFYSEKFNKLSKKCKLCYHSDDCTVCIFHLNNGKCEQFYNEQKEKEMMLNYLQKLEDNMSEYYTIMNTIKIR